MFDLRPPASDDEFAAICDLRGQAFGYDEANRHKPGDRNPLNQVLGYWDRQGQLAGTVRIDREGDHTVLRKLAVAPNQQRQGIGRQMLAAIEDFCATKGLYKLVLGANPEVVGFYLKAGYAEEAWRTSGNLVTQPTVDMIKYLPR